jgi:hypothetical protein
MNLQDFASVAEIMGGVAVVVSLIYVGLQLRDSTSAIRSGAASDATEAMQSWYLELGSNRQASDIWFNAMTSPEPLPTRDEFQFMMSMHTVILGMQNSYLLSKEGTLDAEFREAVTTALVAVKDLPGMDRYWRQRRGYFHTGFAEYVDSLLAGNRVSTFDMYKLSDVAPEH